MGLTKRSYLYVDPSLAVVGVVDDRCLEDLTERHRFEFSEAIDLRSTPNLRRELSRPELAGAIFALDHGVPRKGILRLSRKLLSGQRSVFFFWPREGAIERVDRLRLGSFWRLWVAYHGFQWLKRRQARAVTATAATAGVPVQAPQSAVAGAEIAAATRSLEAHFKRSVQEYRTNLRSLRNIAEELKGLTATPAKIDCARLESIAGTSADLIKNVQVFENIARSLETGVGALPRLSESADLLVVSQPDPRGSPVEAGRTLRLCQDEMRELLLSASPVPFPFVPSSGPVGRIPGHAIYLRTDYWVHLISGGSYGHTCYQARAIAKVADDLICILGSRFPLLDELGLRQIIVRPRSSQSGVADLLAANEYYGMALEPLFEAMRPSVVVERLCLGNYTAAKLCRKLGIPYLVEYNGSEISMQKSFARQGFEHEDLLVAAEDVSFAQASLISVVSQHVRNDVVRRGFDASKVLVNPNGVDLAAYCPAVENERAVIRAELGLSIEDCVVGFIGTFGGWHGIEVLAAAIPQICSMSSRVKFLLIGDGNLKHLVTESVRKAAVSDRVVDVGRVNQRAGARLLKACDILVSPHSANMIDSPFFGSPTKLFEYMAMGAGIVASDLEQIGAVLSPALRADRLSQTTTALDERAVLCRPGSVEEFVDAVSFLASNPLLAARLGANARAAAETYYSWDQHVRNFWAHLQSDGPDGYARDIAAKGIA